MSDIADITKQLLSFRDERDWQQFHDSKNLALALSIEASELNELFLWKSTEIEINSVNKERLSEELADVFAYALLLAKKNKLDVIKIIEDKIRKNSEKYPVNRAKGSSKKYHEL